MQKPARDLELHRGQVTVRVTLQIRFQNTHCSQQLQGLLCGHGSRGLAVLQCVRPIVGWG